LPTVAGPQFCSVLTFVLLLALQRPCTPSTYAWDGPGPLGSPPTKWKLFEKPGRLKNKKTVSTLGKDGTGARGFLGKTPKERFPRFFFKNEAVPRIVTQIELTGRAPGGPGPDARCLPALGTFRPSLPFSPAPK